MSTVLGNTYETDANAGQCFQQQSKQTDPKCKAEAKSRAGKWSGGQVLQIAIYQGQGQKSKNQERDSKQNKFSEK